MPLKIFLPIQVFNCVPETVILKTHAFRYVPQENIVEYPHQKLFSQIDKKYKNPRLQLGHTKNIFKNSRLPLSPTKNIAGNPYQKVLSLKIHACI